MILTNIFWSSVKIVTTLCKPTIELLRLADGISLCTEKMYWKMFKIDQSIKTTNLPSLTYVKLARLLQNDGNVAYRSTCSWIYAQILSLLTTSK